MLKVARVIGKVMANDWDTYIRAGDWVLRTRIVSLIEQGLLCAESDP